MFLAIDAGNTNVCFALFEGEEKKASWRASTDILRTADEWAVWLSQLMALKDLSLPAIAGALVSSVVPQVTEQLRHFCRTYIQGSFYILGENGIDVGNQALIDRPSEAGMDLKVNSFAAHHLFQGPLLVVDFGTATTLSYVDEKGNFCGVSIAPGIKVSLKALYEAAAKLPDIEIACPAKVIGTNTIDSMQSGIFWGYISMVEGLVKRAQNEIQSEKPLKVIATGGLGALIKDHTRIIDHYDADLTLKGLSFIYKRIKAQKNIKN